MVSNEDIINDKYTLQDLEKMSVVQIFYIISDLYNDMINRFIKLSENKMYNMNRMFFNSILLELGKRFDNIDILKELKNFK